MMITGMGDSGGELLSKSCCYFYVAGEGFGGKGDGLIARDFGTFPTKKFIILYVHEGFHLCEHDSTVWDHFCL